MSKPSVPYRALRQYEERIVGHLDQERRRNGGKFPPRRLVYYGEPMVLIPVVVSLADLSSGSPTYDLPALFERFGGKGDLFWRERASIYDARQDRKKRQPVGHACPVCGRNFTATKRGKFCSVKCRVASHRRNAKLPIHSKG